MKKRLCVYRCPRENIENLASGGRPGQKVAKRRNAELDLCESNLVGFPAAVETNVVIRLCVRVCVDG